MGLLLNNNDAQLLFRRGRFVPRVSYSVQVDCVSTDAVMQCIDDEILLVHLADRFSCKHGWPFHTTQGINH